MVAIPLQAQYTTAGTYTWWCPPNVTSVAVGCVGGGGGGGGVGAVTGDNGGGGGGAENSNEQLVNVTPGNGYVLIVGIGGQGGQGNANGSNGGTTTFIGDNITVTANGGVGGTSGNANSAGPGGAGGSGSSNSVEGVGGLGADGSPATFGGGGGGAAGTTTTTGFTGNPGSGSTGGAIQFVSPYGGGAGGNGATTGANGSNGLQPGGGGGGALSTGTAKNGGNGHDGEVIISYTLNDTITLPNNTAGGVTSFTCPLGVTGVTAQAWGAGAGGFDIAPSAGGAVFAGASAFATTYGPPRFPNAANAFDSRVGRQMAHSMQVIYYHEEEYPSASSDSQGAASLFAGGVKLLAVFKCSRRAVVSGGSTLATQQSKLAAGIAYLQSLPGSNFYVSIGNEPNAFGQHGPFGDGTMKDWDFKQPYGAGPFNQQQVVNNHLAYLAAFAPIAATAGVKNAYKPVSFAPVYGLAMFPPNGAANGGADLVMFDWYATDYCNNFPNGVTPFGSANIEGLADTFGMALGIGEWGVSGSGTATLTANQWNNQFGAALLAGFTNRFNTGKKVSDTAYFGADSTAGTNYIAVGDFKIPLLQQLFDLFNAQTTGQTGGAGGGGGEFAQESPLAISYPNTYQLIVGQAGADGQSGGNSSVAGDVHTVTAHGGLVATVQTTGGLGGTGSTNPTHNNGGNGGVGGIVGGGGAGGGGSGGTAAAGNPGSPGQKTVKGAGGVAVAGGGPGGDGGGPNKGGSPPASGPGGGGGARGANGNSNGPGVDGQVTLTGFTSQVQCVGSFTLAPLAFSGQASLLAGGIGLAPIHFSGSANVCVLPQIQVGPIAAGGNGSATATIAASALGSMLVASMTTGSQTPFTGPPGWTLIFAQNDGGGAGRLEMWIYPYNPGGITQATFASGSGDTVRAWISEYKPPVGYAGVVDTVGVANNTTPFTNLSVSTSLPNAGGDLAIVSFSDKFSSAQAGSWTTPAGWSVIRTQVGTANWISSYSQCGVNSGTQSVTGVTSTSTNQTGWAAILATFTIVPVITCTGGFALAPMNMGGVATAVVGPNQVVSTGSFSLSPIGIQSPSQQFTFGQNGNGPLPIKVELLINGSWADVSGYVFWRNDIQLTSRGKADEASTAQAANLTMTFNNQDGTFSPYNTSGQFYPFLARNIQIRISISNVVTPQGAWYTGYRFWGEVPAWPPSSDETGRDVIVQIQAAGVLQRMRQSKFSASALKRYYNNQIANSSVLSPVGYWSIEDGTQAVSFASSIPGGSAMTFTGTPGLAADSNVPGSAPFAQLNSSTWAGAPGSFSAGALSYTTPGTFQWICPAGITSIIVQCVGGGGGGANGWFGPGGGGGEFAAENNLAVTPGKTYTLTVGAGGSGGGGSKNPNSGSSGQNSTFTGDSITVVAHGGGGGPKNSSSGKGAGGTGSKNSVHHPGGDGAKWNGTFNSGQGGGGSGGSGQSGNNGHGGTSVTTGGTGGSAVLGGGPGGTGGAGSDKGGTDTSTAGMMPSSGPGGGGGGGGFNGVNQSGQAGGNGFAGSVQISFGTNPAPAPAAIAFRFVLDVGTSGGVDGSYMGQLISNGTVTDLHVIYHTASTGSLQIRGKSASGSTLFDSGTVTGFSANTQPLLVSAELTQTQANQISWKLTAISQTGTSPVASKNGNISGTLGSVNLAKINSGATVETNAVGIGHITVQYAIDPILNLQPAFSAYVGELAAARFLRLCNEQTVPVVIQGLVSDTPQMGPQPVGLLVDLLQDCENADLGQMYESRNNFGLVYATRKSMQGQNVGAVLDYSQSHIVLPLQPTDDDQLTRNDVIVTRGASAGSSNITGSSFEVQDLVGTMSVNDPPNGVGLYTYSVTANLFSDSQLPAYANWILDLGTVDEFRYPTITIDMTRAAVAGSVFASIANLDITNFLQILNTPFWIPSPVNQLCFGFSEVINSDKWTITINAVPEDPWGTANAPWPTW